MNQIISNRTSPNSNTEKQDVLFHIDENGIATITLNRPEKKNAFDNHTIEALLAILHQAEESTEIKALVLRANGSHFSAGADLKWMQSLANFTMQENIQDAERLAELLYQLDTLPLPTIALVQGAAFGGALGLICCCDIAIASKNTQFCLSEVKLGLVPATICPYVCRAIGQRQARRYMLTAEVISAYEANALDIIHKLVPTPADFSQCLDALLKQITANSPNAVRKAKNLCHLCESEDLDASLRKKTSEIIAGLRVSPEGQEGISAFLEKRKPNWKMAYD